MMTARQQLAFQGCGNGVVQLASSLIVRLAGMEVLSIKADLCPVVLACRHCGKQRSETMPDVKIGRK